jgi:acyl-CoA synthetase (AMP-forming)/AMP-acid ligase II
MSGYLGNEDSPIDDKGWLHTGDLGHLDDAGHLWITGRSKDLIIRGGENIAPAAVERALAGIPGRRRRDRRPARGSRRGGDKQALLALIQAGR